MFWNEIAHIATYDFENLGYQNIPVLRFRQRKKLETFEYLVKRIIIQLQQSFILGLFKAIFT